jgi:hypothetical protein
MVASKTNGEGGNGQAEEEDQKVVWHKLAALACRDALVEVAVVGVHRRNVT